MSTFLTVSMPLAGPFVAGAGVPRALGLRRCIEATLPDAVTFAHMGLCGQRREVAYTVRPNRDPHLAAARVRGLLDAFGYTMIAVDVEEVAA
jgi:hypothetical protein